LRKRDGVRIDAAFVHALAIAAHVEALSGVRLHKQNFRRLIEQQGLDIPAPPRATPALQGFGYASVQGPRRRYAVIESGDEVDAFILVWSRDRRPSKAQADKAHSHRK
jgi:hypothetical protein